MYRRQEKILNHFHLRCLRSLLHIRWQDKIPNTEVLHRARLPSITTITHKAQLRWAGHVSRMHDDRIPKQLFYGELRHGKRIIGGQRKRFKDSLKVSLKDFHISIESWESLASDRPRWRCIVTQGAISGRTQNSPSRLEKNRMQGQNYQHHININSPLPNLWEKLLCPDWPNQPSFGHPATALLTDHPRGHLWQRKTSNILHQVGTPLGIQSVLEGVNTLIPRH